MTLLLGTAKIDITPKHSVPLAGFASRQNEPFTRIASRINMRVAFFEQRLEDGVTSYAVIISADLLWWGNQVSEELREEIHREWGIDSSSVLLHGTHSHSGPQTETDFHHLLGEVDPSYLQQLKSCVMDGIEQARNDLEEVRIWKGKGHCNIGIYRRKVQKDEVYMIPNAEGPIDPEVILFRFIRADHTDKAIFVHFAAHPVISRENDLSSEFPGVAMEMIEERYNNQLTAFYFQGCCGDINVDFVREGQFSNGDESDIRYYANELAKSVEATFKTPFQQIEAIHPFYARSCYLPLDFQKKLSWSDLYTMMTSNSPYREWAGHQLREGDSRQVQLEITLLKLAEGLSFIAMDAEVVTEYGLYIKELSKGSIMPLPYTNGMIGYISTAKQIREGGYEAESSIYYFYLPARVSESNEQKLKKMLCDIMTNE